MKQIAALLLLAAVAVPGFGQEASPVAPPPPQDTAPVVPVARPESKDSFPNLNVYLPDGEIDLRVRKLIKNVLLEGQVDYKFVEGDISTFLRYKYYARDFTYKLGVFDTIEFANVQSGSNDFDRVRGALVQLEYPADYNRRYFMLFQDDRLTFGDTTRPDNNHNNVYAKVGYQFGTPFDERLNSIVGESRGRITPVLTAYRELGPQNTGLAIGLTQSVKALSGDYSYTRLEAEGLKRLDVTQTSFVFSRLHFGSFLQKNKVITAPRPDSPEYELYDIPRYDFFKIGGRDALKGIDDKNRGTDEVHLSNEYFVPIFRNRDYKVSATRWHNLYGIGYLGAGALGFQLSDLTESSRFIVDAGAGFESSLTIRDYELFLSVLYAHSVKAPDEMKGGEIRFALRTSR